MLMYVLGELNESVTTGDVNEAVHKEKKKKRKVEGGAETAVASGTHAVANISSVAHRTFR